MYLRVIRGQTQPGKLEEFVQRWQAIVGPRIAGLPGFRHAYVSGDHRTGAVVSVSLWDELPDEPALGRNMDDFRARVQDLVSGPPSVETYEVLAKR